MPPHGSVPAPSWTSSRVRITPQHLPYGAPRKPPHIFFAPLPQKHRFLTKEERRPHDGRKCAAAPLLTWRSEGHEARTGRLGALFPLNWQSWARNHDLQGCRTRFLGRAGRDRSRPRPPPCPGTLCGSDLLRKPWEQLPFVPACGPGGRLPSPAAAAGYPAVVGMGISGSRGLLLDSVPR